MPPKNQSGSWVPRLPRDLSFDAACRPPQNFERTGQRQTKSSIIPWLVTTTECLTSFSNQFPRVSHWRNSHLLPRLRERALRDRYRITESQSPETSSPRWAVSTKSVVSEPIWRQFRWSIASATSFWDLSVEGIQSQDLAGSQHNPGPYKDTVCCIARMNPRARWGAQAGRDSPTAARPNTIDSSIRSNRWSMTSST